MSDKSAIGWTDATWNPTSGCTKVSPGCAHCYIERTPPLRMAGRRFEKGHIPLQLHPERLQAPLHWRKPRRVFVNSTSDLFHDDVHRDFVLQVFMVMRRASQHTFQVLTKRADRMQLLLSEWLPAAEALADGSLRVKPPAPNVWLGVSVEDQARADERVPLLLKTPAAVRFLSCEPLLGPLNLVQRFNDGGSRNYLTGQFRDVPCKGVNGHPDFTVETIDAKLPHVNWVIGGGESGPGARPCFVGWLRSLRDQCKAAGAPFFCKQLGSRAMDSHACEDAAGGHSLGLRDRKGGDPGEWPEDLRVREFPR